MTESTQHGVRVGHSKRRASAPGQPQGSGSTKKTVKLPSRKSGGLKSAMFWLVRLGLLMILGLVIWFNVQPYVIGVFSVITRQTDGEFVGILLRVPFLGIAIEGLKFSVESLASFILGVVLWAILQAFEILPFLILGSRHALDKLISQVEDDDEREVLEAMQEDEQYLRLLRRRNSIKFDLLGRVFLMALIAYSIDLFCCVNVYPPINGSLNLFFNAGVMGDIDAGNLIMLLLTMFALELLLLVWTVVDSASVLFAGERAMGLVGKWGKRRANHP